MSTARAQSFPPRPQGGTRRRARAVALGPAALLAGLTAALLLGGCLERSRTGGADSQAERTASPAVPATPTAPAAGKSSSPSPLAGEGRGGGSGGTHGLALGSGLKYPATFTHFDYADPKAPKGGTLVLSAPGSFDTLNPFSLKGRPVAQLATLVFEPLTEGSLDEPFAEYGLLAQAVLPAADGLSVTYRLRPEARFSDGRPLTAEDVAFSFRVLRSDAASPFYRYYYKDVQAVETPDPHTVRLRFAQRNAELAMIAGQLAVLPKHLYGQGDFGQDFVRRALGSGPYTVAEYEFGKFIRFRRNPLYWGRRLALNAGKDNFDEIVVKFYRDDTVRLEALKAGEFDFLAISSSKQWAVDVAGAKWDQGWLVKRELPHRNNAGIQGFAFNLRKAKFQQRDVRHALALALDFDWSNRTLFFGQYTANHSYFSNSELAAPGLPAREELALLEPLRAKLPPAVFTTPVAALGKPYRDIREQLRAAQRLLEGAGWRVQGGVLTNTATGEPMRFTVTLVQPAFERVVEPYLDNLRKLGVQATMKVVDDSVYEQQLRTFDFEMVVASFPESQSPGNEQREFWHSDSAAVEGSRNIIGIRNPAVDRLVEAIIGAPDRQTLVTATHALDRVLWHEHYLVPNWYNTTHRVTHWDRLGQPRTLPLYYAPQQLLRFWWADAARAAALRRAMAGDGPLRAR
ncbi:MAG: ABC transporter substrate-binding protein [Candidatus Lambdaproteobacteria bacterium]|nr:ABC transporter substrate-binding protein [Candidatus Lambdaproteobacteria bacterium]